MKATSVTPADLARSVVAVPPLCLTDDLGLAVEENRRLVRHVEAGGVSTILWGGNAQMQHWPPSRYGELLEMAEATAGPDTWVIPAAGPDYGKLLDEAKALAGKRFPAALMLPLAAHWTAEGIARGVRDFVQAAGMPALLYVRSRGYVRPDDLAAMVAAGEVVGVKYAVTVPDVRADPYLADLVAAIGAERLVSGFGEPPAVAHIDAYRLASFTAGCVCLVPRLSMAILAALQRRAIADATRLLAPILPMEAIREKHSPIRVIHAAVALAGIARTGPLYPMLSQVEPALLPAIRAAADDLLAAEAALARAVA